MRAGWRAGPLGVRSFRLLCGGQLASTIGDYCYAVALVAGLAVLAARHLVSLAAPGPIAPLIGAGEGLFIPASYAIMPSPLGPVAGGALVAATRASTGAFAVDAASFGISALTFWLIPAVTGERDGNQRGPGPRAPAGGVLALLRRSRALQVILVVVIAANLASGGMGEVALPALAHATFGAAGYGALLACLAVGGIAGTLAAARTGGLRAPVIFASAVFLAESACLALVPYLGGEAGAAAFLGLVGFCNGLGNVTFLTVLQKWVPAGMLGRVMGALMLCAFGTFPLSVAVTGVLVRHLGPVPFFPVAGALVAAAVLFGLTQREFRTFGARGEAEPQVTSQAAEGSRK